MASSPYDSDSDESIFEDSAVDSCAPAVDVVIGDRILEISQQMRPVDLAPLFTPSWTGSQVWACAVELAKRMPRIWPREDDRKRVAMELGAGCGLVGLEACLLGAVVVATDLAPMVALLDRNADANLAPEARARYAARALEWADAAAIEAAQAQVHKMTGCASAGPDAILISDCLNPLYGEESYEQLAQTVRAVRHPRKRTELLLAYQRRGPCSEELLGTFFKHLGDAVVSQAAPSSFTPDEAIAATTGEARASLAKSGWDFARHLLFATEDEVQVYRFMLEPGEGREEESEEAGAGAGAGAEVPVAAEGGNPPNAALLALAEAMMGGKRPQFGDFAGAVPEDNPWTTAASASAAAVGARR